MSKWDKHRAASEVFYGAEAGRCSDDVHERRICPNDGRKQIRKGRLKGKKARKAKVMTLFHFKNATTLHHLELQPWMLLVNLACSGRLGFAPSALRINCGVEQASRLPWVERPQRPRKRKGI